MAITQDVNIQMLEKLPDGNYKKKNPQTKASQVIANNGQTVEQHLADDNAIKHRAKQIGFNEVGMTATTVNEAILEAFMLGNNTKKDLVDKLLLLDPSLSISYASTWQVILVAISGISTGKKWASGTQAPTFNGSNYFLEATQLGFEVNTIIAFETSGGFSKVMFFKNDGYSKYIAGVTYTNGYEVARYYNKGHIGSYVVDGSFKLYVFENKTYTWYAFE